MWQIWHLLKRPPLPKILTYLPIIFEQFCAKKRWGIQGDIFFCLDHLMERCVRLLWDYYEITLRLLCDHFENALRQLWDYSATTLRLFQNYSKTTLKLLWDYSWTTLGLLWNYSGLGLLWAYCLYTLLVFGFDMSSRSHNVPSFVCLFVCLFVWS